ncbi:hypothetical protein HZ326_28369 [Fusarium oxysporum f. sp. albedinis]|nr:hypothetical protein HZ326_28369 [Fusarium oxysporum f. sp. albedinis]
MRLQYSTANTRMFSQRVAKKSHHQPALVRWFWRWWRDRAHEPYPPQATRENFKNHPRRDREIEPTNDEHMGRGRGHPWGASGLLCCKDTKTRRISDRKREWSQRKRTRRNGILELCTENDKAPWLVGGTKLRCSAVLGTERMQVDKLLRDTVGLAREILRGDGSLNNETALHSHGSSCGRLCLQRLDACVQNGVGICHSSGTKSRSTGSHRIIYKRGYRGS